jgi:peptidoglycan/xylan/chitin deacetylase (PgdA/CDA1 family)
MSLIEKPRTRLARRKQAILVLMVTLAALSPAAACTQQALGTARTLPVGTENGGTVGLKTYPRTLPLADHEVVLTFDDGPLPATTGRILDALREECVKATFFLIGRNAAAAPALVRREVAEGHTVAHHTMTHPALTLRNLPAERAREEVDRGIAADEAAAYGKTGGVPTIPFFRYPGFGDNAALGDWLAQRNILVFGADLWASDWVPMTPEAELALLMRRLDASHKGIILLHDSKAQTAAMLPSFLRALKAGSYRIVHLVPGPGPLDSVAAGKGWSSETEKTLTHMWPKAPPQAR